MILEHSLKAEDIRQQAMKTLKEQISLEAEGYRSTTEMVLDVLLKASAERSRVEAVCADLVGVIDSNTLRDYLNAALDMSQLREQEAEANQALAANIPVSMKREGLEVAIDFHDEPFYGKQPDLLAVTCRGRAKAGTTHFVRIATAYVMWRQVRLTLAVRYVLPEDSTLAVLQHLLRRLTSLGFSFKVLYLDKGFAGTAITRYLTEQSQAALIACTLRGTTGGTKALCRGRKSYLAPYTFKDGTRATLALHASLVPDKTGRRRRKWLALIVIGLDWPPHKIYHAYRRRFGVECSYRLLRRVRASTTSRNPALRFFLLALGLILVNVWVFLRWEFARLLAAGPRRVDPARFRFHRFTLLLIRAIEAVYGTLMSIPTHCSPQSVIY